MGQRVDRKKKVVLGVNDATGCCKKLKYTISIWFPISNVLDFTEIYKNWKLIEMDIL